MGALYSRSEEETERLGERLGKLLRPGDVVAFTGGLGMGKTCFVRGMARGMGLDVPVYSPTFSLVNEYRGEKALYHFDMYRIGDLDDLYSTGFFDYLDTDAVLAVEWSENIAGALPEHTITVAFARDGDEARTITVKGDGRCADFGD